MLVLATRLDLDFLQELKPELLQNFLDATLMNAALAAVAGIASNAAIRHAK